MSSGIPQAMSKNNDVINTGRLSCPGVCGWVPRGQGPGRRARQGEQRRRQPTDTACCYIGSPATFYDLHTLMGWLSGRNRKLRLETMNPFWYKVGA